MSAPIVSSFWDLRLSNSSSSSSAWLTPSSIGRNFSENRRFPQWSSEAIRLWNQDQLPNFWSKNFHQEIFSTPPSQKRSLKVWSKSQDSSKTSRLFWRASLQRQFNRWQRWTLWPFGWRWTPTTDSETCWKNFVLLTLSLTTQFWSGHVENSKRWNRFKASSRVLKTESVIESLKTTSIIESLKTKSVEITKSANHSWRKMSRRSKKHLMLIPKCIF